MNHHFSSEFKPKVFGIIGAMEPEIALLKSQITQLRQQTIGQVEVFSGLLDGKHVALCLSGIGKVNAAIATTILIEHFSVDAIINTGSAGGLGKDLKVGDVVIGTEIAHHDVDVTAFGYVHGQIPQLPARYHSHPHLAFVAQTYSSRRGLIVSGDQFIHGQEQLETIRQHFPDVLAVEMEAAAIAQTCHQFDKPFVVIRAISDNGDSNAAVNFETFLQKAATQSAQQVRDLLKNI